MIDWLLGTFVATSALTLLVLALREPVRRHFGSRVAYGLWLIPVARLFMPTLTHIVERRISAQPAFHPPFLPTPSQPVAMVHVSDPSLFERIGGWPILLAAIWLGVAAALFATRLAAFRRDRRAILGSSIQLAQLGRVRILRTAEVDSPVALGILDKIVAVPSDFDRRYADAE